MLDEILTYQQYTADLKDSKRLNPNVLKGKKLKGVKGALSYIARHFYFEYDYPNGADKIACVKSAMQAWLGDDDYACASCERECFARTKIDAIKDCLPNYLSAIGKEDVCKYLKDKKLSENKKQDEETADARYAEKSYKDINNAIVYDDIVANAMYDGKLKRYALVVKNQEWKKLKIKDAKSDKILKIMAAFFLNRNGDSKTAYFTKDDATNWCTEGKDIMTRTVKKYVENSLATGSTESAFKAHPSDELLNAFAGVFEIDSAQLEKYIADSNYTVYYDAGKANLSLTDPETGGKK